MSTNENLAFPIPNSILEQYIKRAVNSAISASLVDGTNLVDKAIMAALSTKVDINGKISRNSYENKYDLIELVSKNSIQDVTKNIIKELAEEIKPEIEITVRRLIMEQKNQIAKALNEIANRYGRHIIERDAE